MRTSAGGTPVSVGAGTTRTLVGDGLMKNAQFASFGLEGFHSPQAACACLHSRHIP